ncbi:MAG: hypothetical protein ACYCZW_00975 [Minisyncoccota bacterium]
MDALQIRSIIAGVCFGVWPLLMQKSGLSGNASSLVFTGIVFSCVIPFAVGNMGDLSTIHWKMAIISGILSATGVMFFNGMLAKATPQNVSSLFVLMIIVQISVPAIYNIFGDGNITLTKGLGFIFAIIAGVLLIK